jgi:subtilisin
MPIGGAHRWRMGGLATLCLLVVLGGMPPVAVGAQPTTGRWIVQLRDGVQTAGVSRQARDSLGIGQTQQFSRLLNGFAARLTDGQRRALLADPRVKAVVPDLPVKAAADPATQVQPGVKRVGAPANADRAAGKLDVDIAILDTGIDPDNRLLNVVGGYNCTDPSQPESERKRQRNWRDGTSFGHGTHVAGIAAARADSHRVAGVAAGARLWAIKVLNAAGYGYTSWIICGLEYVAGLRDPADEDQPRIEVANMSLYSGGWDDGACGVTNNDLLHQAVCRLRDAGVTMVVAAGNESTDAAKYVPAAYPEVITVAAMASWSGRSGGRGSPPAGCNWHDADETFATFSNHGPAVDLIAPGECVLSTLPGNRFVMMSGTSMATPHVSGGAALYYLWENRAGRPRPTPQSVRAALVARGSHDWRVATDPDRRAGRSPEPLLQVADFMLPPGFVLDASPQRTSAPAGASAAFEVRIAPISGFDEKVSFNVRAETLPTGAAVTREPIAAPAGASSGTRISIKLSDSTVPATYDVTVVARGGGLKRSAKLRLIVEPAAAGGPLVKLRSGVRTDRVALPVVVKWPAVSGATKYELQRSRDGGSWTALTTQKATSVTAKVWPGSRYRYRVRAQVGGTWREWRVGKTQVATPYFAPADGIGLTGRWQAKVIKKAYAELPVYSRSAGATAKLDFVGRSVAWVAARGPGRGKAKVFVDGSLVTTIDLYASTVRHRRVVFARSWPTAGVHSLKVVVTGKPASRPRVDVDTMVVVSTN